MAKVKTSKTYEHNSYRMSAFGKVEFDENGVSQDLKDEQAQALVEASPTLHLCGDDGEVVVEMTNLTQKAFVEDDLGGDLDLTGDGDSGDSDLTGSATIGDLDLTGDGDSGDLENVDVTAVTAESLGQLGMGQLRDALTTAGVATEEFAHFKGVDAKEGLIEFALTKLNK
jgi:hypothetical protein